MKKFLVIALCTYGSLFAFSPSKANEKQINLASLEDEYYKIEKAKQTEEECFKDKVNRSWFRDSYHRNDPVERNGKYTILVYENGIELWTKIFPNNYKCKTTAFLKWDTPYYRVTYSYQMKMMEIHKVIFKYPKDGSIIAFSQLWSPYKDVPPRIEKFEPQLWYFSEILTENYKWPDGDIFDISTGENIPAKKGWW